MKKYRASAGALEIFVGAASKAEAKSRVEEVIKYYSTGNALSAREDAIIKFVATIDDFSFSIVK